MKKIVVLLLVAFIAAAAVYYGHHHDGSLPRSATEWEIGCHPLVYYSTFSFGEN